MIERHHLSIIREVNRLGTMTAAASRLCLTQSALSHAIKNLEQQMGAAIWTKDGRTLRLTQAGEYLLALANRLLPQFEHAEQVFTQISNGQRGTLRIGMECHPCYQWLLKIVTAYLQKWPDVDVDVKQEFQFGGIGALFGHEIDVLVTPDPMLKDGLLFKSVFDYEQVLVVGDRHRLSKLLYVSPEHLSQETLITYPVEIERQDIYSQFLLPANRSPKKHKVIETTDIMLHMVIAGRGVAALPDWLVLEYARTMPIKSVRLGHRGIAKQLFLGIRKIDADTDYLSSFLEMADHSD